MNEQELKGFIENARKTERLLNLVITMSIASLGLSIFTLIWS